MTKAVKQPNGPGRRKAVPLAKYARRDEHSRAIKRAIAEEGQVKDWLAPGAMVQITKGCLKGVVGLVVHVDPDEADTAITEQESVSSPSLARDDYVSVFVPDYRLTVSAKTENLRKYQRPITTYLRSVVQYETAATGLRTAVDMLNARGFPITVPEAFAEAVSLFCASRAIELDIEDSVEAVNL